MKAIFKINETTIVNEQIGNISILIELGEEFKTSNNNAEYVVTSLKNESDIFNLDRFGIESPYEDLVYLYNESFTGQGEDGVYPASEDELKLLIDSYNEAIKVFNKDTVRIAVYSNHLWDLYNEDDFSLDEFLNNYKLIEN